MIKNYQRQIKKNILNFRNEVFEYMKKFDPYPIWEEKKLSDIKNVIIIVSSSRSGSSLLFEILKKLPEVFSLQGETNPFYKLNTTCFENHEPKSFCDNIFHESVIDFNSNNFSRDILSGVTFHKVPSDFFHNKKLQDLFAFQLLLRFSLQWPEINFEIEKFFRHYYLALDLYIQKHSSSFYDKERFYLELLKQLQKDYLQINPYYYDINPNVIKDEMPNCKLPYGPPNEFLTIEEPPFILLSPGSNISPSDISQKTLLVKSTIDQHRLDEIKNIFPDAEIKYIYLKRNPSATINGLYEGWLHRGFFSYNLKEHLMSSSLSKELAIRGYSDQFEWGKFWWNFDLPPGWVDYISKSLEEVCAFQWISSHENINKFLNLISSKCYCTVKHEDIIYSYENRGLAISNILSFFKISTNVSVLNIENIPVVQATSPPMFFRWKKRKEMILNLLDSIKIYDFAEQLGYKKKDIEKWM